MVPVNTRRDLKPWLDADVLTADAIYLTEAEKYDMGLISVLIGVLVIVVVGFARIQACRVFPGL